MSSKQNNSEDSKDHSSTSLDILFQIRQKLIDMGDPPFSLHPHFIEDDKNTAKPNDESVKSQKRIKCIYCLNDIQNSDILCTMPCCNGICHVKCVKEINGNEDFLQACPKCLTKLSPKFKETIESICTVL